MSSSKIFTQTPIRKPQRSYFDHSHELKTSSKFGFLQPIFLKEALPGDEWHCDATIMCRFAPMLAPIMHRVDVITHFFFVPNRLVTDHWEEFITGGRTGVDPALAPVLPYYTPNDINTAGAVTSMGKGTLWDWFGLPVFPDSVPGSISTERISALPFRAYQKIWNDYYRDPNLQDERDLNLELQGNVTADDLTSGMMAIGIKSWEKDYFTSALPWAQRGAQVLIPIAGTGSFTYKETSNVFTSSGLPPATNELRSNSVGASLLVDGGGGTYTTGRIENLNTVSFANGSSTINDLRSSWAIQVWLENNARSGYRYNEQIMSHFNVRVPDYRLQRAEYLGGGKQPVQISEVRASAATQVDTTFTPVGDLAGYGLSVGRSNRFKYYCQEHGHILGIMTVIPRTAYFQGIDRMWSRQTRYDYAWPEFARLGEQQIKNKELFYSFNATNESQNNGTFGYIPRYSEYKFSNDRITGDMRSSLLFWHLARRWNTFQSLSPAFTSLGAVEELALRRIFAVQDGTDYLWFQIYFKCGAKRPLPYFGVPSIM